MMEFENFFNKTNKKSVSFRLSEKVISRLKDLGETLNASQAEIIELLVTALHYSEKNENNAPYENVKWFEKVLEMCKEQLQEISPMDLDILNEVYKVSMGAAASRLSNLLKVDGSIKDPKSEILRYKDFMLSPDVPYVGVVINYHVGVQGINTFIFKQLDVMKFVDIWMGGKGQIDENSEFNEMQMSGIGELVNQMMGQSSMVLAGFLNMVIDIAKPISFKVENNDYKRCLEGVSDDDVIIATKFKFTVGNIIDSQITLVSSMPLAKEFIRKAKKSFGMANE